MAIRIRVHPQIGGAYGAYGGLGAVTSQQYYGQQLQNERDTSNLRLQYERALWQEKLKETQLSSALQYGAGSGVASPFALGGVSALGLGGVPATTGINPWGGLNALSNMALSLSALQSAQGFWGGLGGLL